MEEEKPKIKREWKCKLCEKNFSSKQRLTDHVEKAICMGKSFMCNRCLDVFSYSRELMDHQTRKRKCKIRKCVKISKNEDGKLVVEEILEENMARNE